MEGNQLFQEKKVEEAFQRYNMSVLRARSRADNKSEEENTLALSLGKVHSVLLPLDTKRDKWTH